MSGENLREYYKGLTVPELKKQCRDAGIPFGNAKKADLINFLVEKASVNSKEKPVPISKLPSKEKKASRKPTATMVDVNSLQVQLKDVKLMLINGQRTQALISLIGLKNTAESYEWGQYNSIAEEVKALIKEFVENARKDSETATSSPRRTFKKDRKKPEKTKYKKRTINISFREKEGETSNEVSTTTISLDELRQEIESDDFISRYVTSIRNLIDAKKNTYKIRIRELRSEYEQTKIKSDKLRKLGMDDKAIKDRYPLFEDLKVYIVDMEDLDELLDKKRATLTSESVKEDLLDAIFDRKDGLDSLVGREDIKNQIASQIFSFSKGYQTFYKTFNNIALYGESGVGKTAVAKVLGYVYSKMGVLMRGNVKIVTRADLVGQYIGQTAPRTRSVLIDTLEGILFIDEAYQIVPKPQDEGKDFGKECITEIVNFLDKYIGMSVVIVAGYERDMKERFMASNEGLPRRFPHEYVLKSYTAANLTDILVSNIKSKLPDNIQLDEDVINLFYSIVLRLKKEMPHTLANQAGDMLNLASSIVKTINSSYQLSWDSDLDEKESIILEGFQNFLKRKGETMYHTETS